MEFLYIFIGVTIFLFFSSFFTVKQQTAVIIERFGKYSSIRQSGLHLKIPVVDRIAGRVNLKNSTIRCHHRNQN
jgi:regulator of protease activity HflC (stomatin/prohibitin superfamily)